MTADIRDTLAGVLRGIDRVEGETPDGWWETTAGADFGAAKLAEVETAVRGLVAGELRAAAHYLGQHSEPWAAARLRDRADAVEAGEG